MKLVNSTRNGQLFECSYCQNKLRLEFGNIFLHLSYDEFTQFAQYINSIDYQFYLTKNRNAPNRRKLILCLDSKNVNMALNIHEFLELKDLVSLKSKPLGILNHKIELNITLN